jgi:hypothetical protein
MFVPICRDAKDWWRGRGTARDEKARRMTEKQGQRLIERGFTE